MATASGTDAYGGINPHYAFALQRTEKNSVRANVFRYVLKQRDSQVPEVWGAMPK